MQLEPDPRTLARFTADLDALVPPGTPLGVAVSGGPDSVALLLLCAAARRQEIAVATVDHSLRAESAGEAAFVAEICAKLGVPHSILSAQWQSRPESAVQERARAERYRLLAHWMEESALDALAVGHHLDDQAETVLMRLNRGAGVRGLAAIRPSATVPGSSRRLVRPLLGWRHPELVEVCASAGVEPVDDGSNRDERFERVRVRRMLADDGWIDPVGVARSAAHLALADATIDWAADQQWRSQVECAGDKCVYTPGDAPAELRRRIAARAIAELAHEGQSELRGRELDQLVEALESGGTATLRGVRCSGGPSWTFAAAPPRRG